MEVTEFIGEHPYGEEIQVYLPFVLTVHPPLFFFLSFFFSGTGSLSVAQAGVQ